MSSWQAAGFLLCVALATATQRITGFALALVLLGLTSLFELAPLPDVANVATVLSLASASVALRGARRSVDMPMLRSTVAGSVFGIAAGVALLGWLSASVVLVLRLLLGCLIVACAILVLVRTRPLPRRSSAASFRACGLLSGVLGGLFSASGPPLVYQFYRQPLPLETVRNTLVAALAAAGLIRLALVLASGQFGARSVVLCVLALPVVLAIAWWLNRHPPGWDRNIVLKIVCALLLVTGAGLIGPAALLLLR